jgi:nitrous oxidase accessory protein NosD
VLTRSPVNTGFEANGTTISHNLITGTDYGVLIDYPFYRLTISDNVFRNDTVGVYGPGALFDIQNTSITGNAFVRDGAAGVLIDTTGTGTKPVVISGNTFTRDGFHSGGLTDHAGHPVTDGLHVNSAPGSDIVITGNHTRSNAAYGIYAQPGTVVDGGGNTSVGNPDGCLGVACG